MKELRFAVFGAGFWSHFQLAAWHELKGARCVAIYNRTLAKAKKLAEAFGIPAVYDQPEAMLRRENIDFVDIITDAATHAPFVHLAAKHRKAVLCQKPLAPSVAIAEKMIQACRKAQVPFFVHENWRWQTPLRQIKRILDQGTIGPPFRARLEMISGFPVFKNQPFLKEMPQFILADLGTHLLDTARFLFGEARNVACLTHRVHSDIQGEDVATVMMKTNQNTTVLCQMAYAGNPLERERFPETFCFVEGTKGSIELGPDYWIRTTTRQGTHAKRYPPPRFSWADPAYEVVHASIVPCLANLLQALRGGAPAETSAEDNLKTLKLVEAAYQSAEAGRTVQIETGE